MPKTPHVRLAVVAVGPPSQLQEAVNSCRHLIDSAVVVIHPRDFASLPAEGLGFIALETRVVQVAAGSPREVALAAAEKDGIADWVLMLGAGDRLALGAVLPDLERHEGRVDAWEVAVERAGARSNRYGHLLRARRGWHWAPKAPPHADPVAPGGVTLCVARHAGMTVFGEAGP